MPKGSPLSIRHLEWGLRVTGVPFISFDVKWVALLSTARKGLEFNWSFPKANNDVSIYIFVIQNVHNHIALIPPGMMAGYTSSTSATTAIVGNVPLEFSAFMVADIHLKMAIRNLFRARSLTEPYHNPTTGLRTKGWAVQTTLKPAIVPLRTSGAGLTFEVLRSLCISIITYSQYDVLQNRIAPMMGDFFIVSPDGLEMLIEHKIVNFGAHKSVWQLYRDGRPGASPFAASRCWTYLVIQSPMSPREKPTKLIVISRDQVPVAWQSASMLRLRDLEDELPQSCFIEGSKFDSKKTVLAMLEFMAQKYTAAVQAVTAILTTLPAGEIGKLNKDSHDTYLDIADGTDNGELSDLSQTGVRIIPDHYHRQIDIVAHTLNKISRSHGFGFCVILPPGHAYGDLLFIEHFWDEEERQRYDDYRVLPTQVYDYQIRDAIGIPIRTADMAAPGICPDPFQLRVFHYRKSPYDQPHITIGIPIPAIVAAELDILPRFIFLPSCLTKLLDPTNIKRNDFPNGHDGDQYLRTIVLSDDTLDLEETSFDRSTPIRKGCEIMRDPNMDPLRLTRSCEDIYWHLRYMLKGEKQCSIRNPINRDQVDVVIDASRYLVSIQDMHTAGWDFGRKCS